MDDSHHADGPTHKKPRRSSCNAKSTRFSTPQFQQLAAMNQSQILTPPITPPHSPRPSMLITPEQKPTRSERLPSRVHFDLHMSIHRSSTTTSTTIDSSMSESSLWTLPGSDDGGNGPETTSPPNAPAAESRWPRRLQDAATSSRARPRARREGDG